jgi:hypothetical protein
MDFAGTVQAMLRLSAILRMGRIRMIVSDVVIFSAPRWRCGHHRNRDFILDSFPKSVSLYVQRFDAPQMAIRFAQASNAMWMFLIAC